MPQRENMVDESNDSTAVDIAPFEEKISKRVDSDFEKAKEFLADFHTQCVASYEHYFNASLYIDMKKKNKFPMPFFQQMVDDFKSYLSDKLFYKNQPCTVVPSEDSDKGDADAKQDLFKWMDYKDNIEGKMEIFLQDCALYRLCVSQIDYEETTQTKLVGKIDESTGQPVSSVEVANVPLYRGARVKRIDPVNFFICQDKQTIDDGKPVMIRSYHHLDYFKSKKYFINIDKLDAAHINRNKPSGGGAPENLHTKRMFHGLKPDKTATTDIEYIEWQAQVNKKELYEYLNLPIAVDVPNVDPNTGEPDGTAKTVPIVSDTDQTWCICGKAEKVVVRLEELAFPKPNVIVGVMQEDENELIGTSLADKIGAVQQGMEVLMGILLENFRQSVNAGHVIKKTSLITEGDVMVNKPGWTLLTNEDVSKVHKRVDQPRVAPDIYQMLGFFQQMGRDAGGIQKPISAQGDPDADTLGEYEGQMEESAKKMVKYLRSFERTLVQPMYDMRNQINMLYLDIEYVYGIIGDGAIEWRKMEPEKIRANVDFICESSTREGNRLVITQQILQLGKIAPTAIEMGFPIRFDVLLGKLAEHGFSWDRDQVEEVFPTIKMEREGGLNLNQMLLENMMLKLNMEKVMMMAGIMGGGQAPGPGGGPQPRSEGEASQGLHQSNRTQPARTE